MRWSGGLVQHLKHHGCRPSCNWNSSPNTVICAFPRVSDFLVSTDCCAVRDTMPQGSATWITGKGRPSPVQTGSLSTPPLCPGTSSSGFKAWLSSASSMKPAIPRHPKPMLSPPKPLTLCLIFPTPALLPLFLLVNVTSLLLLSKLQVRAQKSPCQEPPGPPLVVILLSSLCLSPGPQVCSFRRETSVEGAG